MRKPPRIVCEHVANATPGHMLEMHGEKKSNRMCCPKCYRQGFLAKELDITVKGGKQIGEIK